MKKQRRRKNRTRITKARIRKGIEQLESRVLPAASSTSSSVPPSHLNST